MTNEQDDDVPYYVNWQRALEACQQQLAQSREQIERLQARDAEWTESQAKAVTRYAQARALLEKFTRLHVADLTIDMFNDLQDEYSAFLAGEEPSDG